MGDEGEPEAFGDGFRVKPRRIDAELFEEMIADKTRIDDRRALFFAERGVPAFEHPRELTGDERLIALAADEALEAHDFTPRELHLGRKERLKRRRDVFVDERLSEDAEGARDGPLSARLGGGFIKIEGEGLTRRGHIVCVDGGADSAEGIEIAKAPKTDAASTFVDDDAPSERVGEAEAEEGAEALDELIVIRTLIRAVFFAECAKQCACECADSGATRREGVDPKTPRGACSGLKEEPIRIDREIAFEITIEKALNRRGHRGLEASTAAARVR